MFYGKEKDRSSAGTETPVKTKNYIAGESLGDSDSTQEVPQAPLTEIQKQWRLVHDAYQRGYSQGLKEGLAQGPTHPAVQISVATMPCYSQIREYRGQIRASIARQRSTQRFWQQRTGGDAE